MRPLPQVDRSQTIAAFQRKLMLDDKPSLVLATVEMARHFLPGHDEDDILAMVAEHGFLQFAWNIALPSSAAREIRIFPDCITWYARTAGRGEYPYTLPEVLNQMLPACRAEAPSEGGSTKPFIKGTTLRLLLNCSSTHLINLIEAKLLKLQPGTSYSRGRDGTPLITLSSVRQFLTSRQL